MLGGIDDAENGRGPKFISSGLDGLLRGALRRNSSDGSWLPQVGSAGGKYDSVFSPSNKTGLAMLREWRLTTTKSLTCDSKKLARCVQSQLKQEYKYGIASW